MPLTAKGEKVMANMQKEYGPDKAKKVFYASANSGRITGVHGKKMKGKAKHTAMMPMPSRGM